LVPADHATRDPVEIPDEALCLIGACEVRVRHDERGHDERSFGSLNDRWRDACRTPRSDLDLPGHARRLVLVSASERAS